MTFRAISSAAPLTLALAACLVTASAHAQTAPVAATAPTAVPALIPFNGTAQSAGKPLTGLHTFTFQLFANEQGGEPLWTESQSVAIDASGHYSVQLGATSPSGLPVSAFASGEGRWLEVQIAGQPAPARILLMSVPYAMKAADAATLGGLPASAFALAGNTTASTTGSATPVAATSAPTSTVTTPGGTSGYLAVFNTPSSIEGAILYQSGTGIGIDTATPNATLDVDGSVDVRGLLSIESIGTANAGSGQNSEPLAFFASAYNSASKKPSSPQFELQAVPSGNDTAAPSATLNVLYGNGSKPAQTGFSINANGTLNFVPGQTFPVAAGGGTITGVTAGSGLLGGGTSGDVTLSLNTADVPQLTTANNFTGAQTFTGGNVGIGTKTPATALDISVSAAGALGPTLTLANPGGGAAAASIDFNTDPNGPASVFGPSARIEAVSDGFGGFSDDLTFLSYSNSHDTYRGLTLQTNMTISADGEVGIPYAILPAGIGGYQLAVEGTGGSETPDGGPQQVSVGESAISATGGSSLNVPGGDGGDFSGGGSSFYEFGIGSYGGTFLGGDVFTGGTPQVPGTSTISGDGIYAAPGTGSAYNFVAGYAADLNGNVVISGTTTSAVPAARIDDPADPANKYLVHASVQSSEMMNIYTGNVVTDHLGMATVTLPSWFESFNSDFRYQLTTIGRDAHAWIAQEVANGRFVIGTNASNVKVSWQITAVRNDAYAKAHPLVVEQAKPNNERGYYQNPELYGQPAEKQTEWGRHPQQMQRIQQMKAARKVGSPSLASRPRPGGTMPTPKPASAANRADNTTPVPTTMP